MPSSPVKTIELVAEWLSSQGYNDTLKELTNESGFPFEPKNEINHQDKISLEKLVHEHNMRELAVSMQKLNNEITSFDEWSKVEPEMQLLIQLPDSEKVTALRYAGKAHAFKNPVLLIATQERNIRVFDVVHGLILHCFQKLPSIVLNICPVDEDTFVTTNMDGKVYVFHYSTDEYEVLEKKHLRFATNVRVWKNKFLVTTGFDGNVFLYQKLTEDNDTRLTQQPFQFVKSISLPNRIDCIEFLEQRDSELPFLLVNTHDSPFVETYSVPELVCVRQTNLNINEDLYVSFNIMDAHICPTKPQILGLVTDNEPYGRFLAVSNETYKTIADHWTNSPQTKFSQPRFVWRSDATGVWMNGDDTVIRGVESKSGREMCVIEGHTAPVRCLETVIIKGREHLISGAQDSTVRIWRLTA
ncbi:hypothetical protein SJAG_02538 [Schizosaccharomyces japonicus yFS275]|uniref:WD repeat protein n=1 Tax=Schizosaccharomyces japonicus (strain yFS275 / FY16936) TaxID=402676 RepID=B6K0I2_SCHJY|nr:hypothetical protein SJAG_02538 [Schizosaccharomyces japonicus yFS275]EEB07453.2 hypothetical protein SJAG_02538 [Schizosaccharomyces japonicus yFS275]